MKPGQEFIVDLVIVCCQGCTRETRLLIDPPFRAAADFIDWHETKFPTLIKPCPCGSQLCDLKLRLVDPS